MMALKLLSYQSDVAFTTSRTWKIDQNKILKLTWYHCLRSAHRQCTINNHWGPGTMMFLPPATDVMDFAGNQPFGGLSSMVTRWKACLVGLPSANSANRAGHWHTDLMRMSIDKRHRVSQGSVCHVSHVSHVSGILQMELYKTYQNSPFKWI